MKNIFAGMKIRADFQRSAVIVILLGLLIRIYSFIFIPLINPDGTFYIQQARALYYGLWDSLTGCFHYLSVYPILIAGIYKLFGDWIVAAQIVSLFFGTISLIPIYALARRFGNETVSVLTLLIFALLPCFVYVSRDVMRDPVYWFFALSGLYFFTLGIEGKGRLFFALGSIAFIMGMWARIEAALFVFVSTAHIVIHPQKDRKERLFFFILPILILSSLAVCYISAFRQDMITLMEPRILTLPRDVISAYHQIRDNLRHLADQNPEGFSPYFFPAVRNLIWLIALAELVVEIVEALFHVFAVILIVGIAGMRQKIRADARLTYFSLLSVSALCILYCQIMYNWSMTDRFAVLFIFPSFVFIGFGLQDIATVIERRLKCSSVTSHAMICLLILLLLVPKTLRANYLKDKLVFIEIGEYLSQREGNEKEILVAGFLNSVRMVHFYANLNYRGAPCFDVSALVKAGGPPLFVQKDHANYFLSDEKSGGQAAAEQLLNGRIFLKIKEWQTPVLGHMILYKIKE